jgi:hypothetical protein
MRCPQCGNDNPDDEWNCLSCRINLYWASRHYEGLVAIRTANGQSAGGSTPSFLIGTHRAAMEERADRGGRAEHRVRQIARRVMQR